MLAIFWGPQLWRDHTRDRLLREGVEATAHIREIKTTGSYWNNQPEVRIYLNVHGEGNQRIEAEFVTYMSPIYLPTFVPGALVHVRYDRNDPQKVVIVGP